MPTESAPPAPAAEAVAAPTPADAIEAAVARIEARKEAADAGGKAETPAAGAPSANPTNAAAAAGTRPKASDLGALAQREWQARQREQQAAQVQGKFRPLEEKLAGPKKDIRGAMELLAKDYGVSFADFVTVLTEAEPPAKTATETAEEVVARKLAERDADAAKQHAERTAAESKAREEHFRTQLQAQAEKGADGAPDRWELTAIAGKGGEAWDVISGHYLATTKTDAQGRIISEGEKLSVEQALDLIESKLKEKREARRPKAEPAPGAGGQNGRNEAAGNATDGRAAAPSFTNRATSGMPAAVGAQPIDEAGLPDHEAIARVASRLGIRL